MLRIFILIHLLFLSICAVAQGGVVVSNNGTANICTVTPNGNNQDDVPNILSAFSTCGTNAKVVFLEGKTYWIATKLNPLLSNVEIDWHGTWLFSDDLTYWRKNAYPIAFQNHHAGFVISGDNIRINGYGTGGINGNGDVWYNAEQAITLPGRPMPFVFWNVSQVVVQSFFVVQPQLWSINIMNGTNMLFRDMYVNATASMAPYGTNWVQNTDGFDTMDAHNIELDGLIYQGGDDCIAIKPRSYNINVRNVTCRGGNGIAIGSLGQYLEDSSVENVQVDNVDIIRYNNDMENGAYIKTWVGALVNQSGYESNYQPRGAGWGYVRNILFSNFRLQGPDTAGSISQSSGDNGSFSGTSLMEISNIAFVNFTGYTNYRAAKPNQISSISCSNIHPCYNIAYENFTVSAGQNATAATAITTCAYTAADGVRGVNGCVNSVPTCWRQSNCTGPLTAAFSGPWDFNIFAPATRNVAPKSILSWPSLTPSPYPGNPIITGNGSKIVYDWGIEVGGIARNYIGDWSDESNGGFGVGRDGALYTNFTSGASTYTMPDKSLRGGFRYMTVFLGCNDTTTSVALGAVNVELDFQPTWSNLKAYQGYFHSNDELLNRIWYAGAYTLQSNAVPVNTGRWVPNIVNGWANNGTLGPGQTIIVDGAKRDRAVWPGDMGIAVPSAFVSTGDLVSVMNALQIMYNTQNKVTGAFAESGPPLSQLGSDTYHMWSMIGTYNYFLYSNDLAFLKMNWPSYLLAMNFVINKIDPTLGLMNVTGLRDWARQATGGIASEPNMILVETLKTGSSLATWLNNTTLATQWTTIAASLTIRINAALWDPSANAYKDNITIIPNMIHPQDANSMSLLFDIVPTPNTSLVTTSLLQNWTPIGPVTPELPDNISPFITSFELLGRLHKRDTLAALALLRRTWGFILNNPNSTQSTLLEGYTSNGSFAYRSYRGYGYDSSYTSHSHGWSTGPTSALSNYILGLDVTQPAGRAWTLAPQVGDLESVEGGFTTALGGFRAGWTRDVESVSVVWETPLGTSGALTLPVYTGSVVYVNGVRLANASVDVSFLGERTVSVAVPGGLGSAEVLTASSLGKRRRVKV